MASCIISTVVPTTVRKESIYTLKLLRRGVDIFKGRELNILKSLRVDDVMSVEVPFVTEGEPLVKMIDGLSHTRSNTLYVKGHDDEYLGRIDFNDIRQALVNAEALSGLVVAGDLAHEDKLVVTPEEGLDVVMRIFAGRGPEELAVVAPTNGKLVGVVTRRHILDAYNQELLKRDMVSSMGDAVSTAASREVQLGGDSRMIEMDAPGSLCGKALRDLDVRSRYGVQILLVRRPAQPGSESRIEMVPGPDTVLQRGDRVLLVGTEENISTLSRW